MMRADGTKRQCVVQNAFENRHPALAADGSFLIYQSRREGKWNLYRVQADGSEEKQLTTLDGSEPVINRQGDQVAFISSRSGRAQVYLMNPDGSNQMLLAATPGADSQPFFLHSGRQLGYLERTAKGKSDVFLFDLADALPVPAHRHRQMLRRGHDRRHAYAGRRQPGASGSMRCRRAA